MVRIGRIPDTRQVNLIIDPENPRSKTFNPREQTWRLFKELGVRLVMTIVFIALIIAALKVFESRGNVSKIGKRSFNFVITGLSLLLGLSFFVSISASTTPRPSPTVLADHGLQDAFKDMAKVLRWRILANQDFSLRETDLILGGDSLMTLTTLMRESKKKPRTLIVCALWVSFGFCRSKWACFRLLASNDGKSFTITLDKRLVPNQVAYVSPDRTQHCKR